ncbi:DNA-binding transcriptional regulator, MarR family [Paenibacillus uliginis N3/975]|uniref:DNA-binding transcriptional regulator, MarR family n=1 Tax=Paenibacillus uliginis N3/975 TaxID=1313296 RepID=A0A1X7HD52_9BACL|nr:MarR family transcriptional regulator [Paenibacillus uliginis]SMF84241.1 DNA-binding transcriptional regulator, MarR family [Paenibacillus uliginis N3/975]
MNRKPAKEYTTEQQLPQLGTAPYLDLMDRTASSDTDRNSAHLGLIMLWLGDNTLDLMDIQLSSFDITESKLDLLLLLSLHAGQELVTPSSLADRLGIRRSSVTSLLNWLEKRNWIIREPYAKDGRMTHVRISSEGDKLVKQVLPTFWSTCASLVEGLDKEEQEVFKRALVKLNNNIEKRLGSGR